MSTTTTHKTACILCSLNCGIEVEINSETKEMVKLIEIRDTHGDETIAYAGGGGQGNHLSGAYSSAIRTACGTPYIYSSLAQEKTGNFWVHGKLLGFDQIS